LSSPNATSIAATASYTSMFVSHGDSLKIVMLDSSSNPCLGCRLDWKDDVQSSAANCGPLGRGRIRGSIYYKYMSVILACIFEDVVSASGVLLTPGIVTVGEV
jgi:hypothetical protein